jgi:hypothetical protein
MGWRAPARARCLHVLLARQEMLRAGGGPEREENHLGSLLIYGG